jgi:hypothetical protein
MKKLLVGAALASVATISLSACGSSNSADPATTQAISSLKQHFLDEAKSDPTNPINTDANAGCVADGVVKQVGIANLKKYGVLDASGNAASGKLENMNASKADATTIVNIIFSCVGNDQVTKSVQDSLAKDAGSMPAAAAACLKNALDIDTIKSVLIAGFEGQNSDDGKALMATFTSKMMACATAK